jgi:site-specific DNA-methyltransferase (adenine-specific)
MIITILRKSLGGSVADNVLKHGCGALDIDATRVGTETMVSTAMSSLGGEIDVHWKSKPIEAKESTGRWPANFILIGDCPVQELDRQSGIKTNTSNYSYKRSNEDFTDKIPDMVEKSDWRTETGGASRFFKQFKKENDQ